ncbi:zinc ribbon domain-containing protein YjdM [Fundicoccus culcitae]|uniref:Zinc ribbon domain-containing protein YjdM n=1 Tax=Fundicoccus culcitae TaxID=2969821 RepID=A0ABY5P224_9LACT|nr:zinc ribbon domain-containing protein YjdM [Fundicoccus culcitae]UUX32762.1 zinc ribbon domain-containing protein YjdM [Fundicoccus culcitae]
MEQRLPNCPQCQSVYTYMDQEMYVCPECGHEWSQNAQSEESVTATITDSNGNPLEDGDSVVVIKDLKVKGAKSAIKQGTKIKNIKLIHDPADGHDIDCNIEGFGAMKLKSEFVKKA